MTVAVLGATGATGRLLVREALARGLRVTALARDPHRLDIPGAATARADVHDPGTIRRALENADVLVSALGGPPGTLTAGAEAVVAASPGRIIWLGAYGTGPSAQAAGAPTRALLGLALRNELPDKLTADRIVLEAGGTLFHAGPLTNGAQASHYRTLTLEEAPRRFLPATVSRATVAAAMIDEAIAARFPGRTLHPVTR